MSISSIRNSLRQNKHFRTEYDRPEELAFAVAQEVYQARLTAGLSQKELARRLGTKQSSVARLESGNRLPSLSFLERIAKALKIELTPPKLRSEAVGSSPAGSANSTRQFPVPVTEVLSGLDQSMVINASAVSVNEEF